MSGITYKTKEDLEALREGGKRLARIVRLASEKAQPGVSTGEIDAYVKELIAEHPEDKAAFLGYTPRGADRPYPGAICISVNDEVVHGIGGDYVLKDGDIVGLDCGLVHKGLITDHAVTVAVGSVHSSVAQMIADTKRALEVGIGAISLGGHIGDISAAIEAVLKEGGYGIVRDLAGHGVGYQVHEPPFVPNYGEAGTGPEIKPGMVLALEPMATLGGDDVEFDEKDGYTVRTADGSLSAHFEHSIAISEDGVEILTKE